MVWIHGGNSTGGAAGNYYCGKTKLQHCSMKAGYQD
eukprot:CAMPEP_0194780584 /NCGR_PEP_ID=MMETSP0323_2-20130528/74023_1 /TAXON_ID=2866 ORGANISM="Crypthecodinium cohnii, Strain Seligo" /NCGR_SAMPLE_ID=MMETSP0323_2 /ASSEMBLY_ACC=CAM_ASM_000346 /LENGTH=35 /DNA_ID= /DNA_START= /DNA_END= /DNA_ORIENTATION=